MGDWQRFGWADHAHESTVALVADHATAATELLERLGPTEDVGSMTFAAALDLQGSFYDDGTFEDRAVFQVDRCGRWWGLVEPNGFRLSLDAGLLAIAAVAPAVSFFWNVNAVMSVLRAEGGAVVATFDPLLDVDEASRHADDLPFADNPRAAAFALIERWTGVTITEAWFDGAKPTFVVQTPVSSG
jgi:Family of unknown function (DUF6461)